MIAHDAAIAIMDSLHKAEADLIGATVQAFNGEAGTVRALKLDEHHGLCFTFDEEPHVFDVVERGSARRYYPVSTIRMKADADAPHHPA